MNRPLGQSLKEKSGATIVEFGLTAPLFIALLVGVIEIGLALWTQFGLQYGSEAAARCASINATDCGTSDQVTAYAASHVFGLSLPTSVFSLSTPSCGKQVSANYTYRFYTLFFGTPTVMLAARSCFPSAS
jgi:Flp pilus assembly protein TadG